MFNVFQDNKKQEIKFQNLAILKHHNDNRIHNIYENIFEKFKLYKILRR